VKIFSGSSNKPLAEKIATLLKKRLGRVEINIFADGEKRIRVTDKIVGKDCAVLQSTSTDVDKNYMELFFIADAFKRNGARAITAVIPYLGYQRQDHMFRVGEAVSLDVIVKMLEGVGIDKIVAVDLHSIKIPELFHIGFVHLSALPIFAEKIKEIISAKVAYDPAKRDIGSPRFHNSVLVSPDMGGIRRIKILSKMLGNMPYAAVVKNRDVKTGKITVSNIEGELKKNAIIVDDMISTGRTIVLASELLRRKGVEEIFVFATHPVFSQDCPKALQQAFIEKVFVTDTIEVSKEKQFPKLEVLSVAEIIGEALKLT
jgi:ribose-phosphate pyrophosphokinase